MHMITGYRTLVNAQDLRSVITATANVELFSGRGKRSSEFSDQLGANKQTYRDTRNTRRLVPVASSCFLS